jgi:hypothetical protein
MPAIREEQSPNDATSSIRLGAQAYGWRSTCARCGLTSLKQQFTRLQPFNLFVREGRASNLHSTDFGRRNKLSDICDGEIPVLSRWEKLFESTGTAGRNHNSEVDGLTIDGSPGMGNAGGKGDDISCMQDTAPVRTHVGETYLSVRANTQ